MFRIGVFGSFNLYKSIAIETMGRRVDNKNIETMNLTSFTQLNLANFNILVIGSGKCTPEILSELTKRLNEKHTLIIADKAGLLNYRACITLEIKNNKLVYRFSDTNFEKAGIKYNKTFEMMAEKTF